VAVLKVECPWKIGGREPCSQTPTYDISATTGNQAIAGMSAIARIPAATGTPALSKGHQQEKAQSQQQNAIKGAGNEARDMAGDCKNLVAVKGPQVAVVFVRSRSKGLQGFGNTGPCSEPNALQS
jgi:hypothetical protein